MLIIKIMKCPEEVILGLPVILCTAPHSCLSGTPHSMLCDRTYTVIDGTDLECEPVSQRTVQSLHLKRTSTLHSWAVGWHWNMGEKAEFVQGLF